jgi:hypothetical protein
VRGEDAGSVFDFDKHPQAVRGEDAGSVFDFEPEVSLYKKLTSF